MSDWGVVTDPEPKKTTTPTQTSIEFEPVYETIDDIRHEFTGSLWIPTAEDSSKAAAKQREKDAPTPDLTSFVGHVTTVISPFPKQWRTGRVKMSAQELIRLSATKGK